VILIANIPNGTSGEGVCYVAKKQWLLVSAITFGVIVLIALAIAATPRLIAQFSGLPTVALLINGVPVSGDVSGKVVEGEPLVPLRQLAEILGVTVHWDEQARTFSITAPAGALANPTAPRFDPAAPSNQWTLGSIFYVFGTKNTGERTWIDALVSQGRQFGYHGATIDEIYRMLPIYGEHARSMDTLVLLNYYNIAVQDLNNWPTHYQWLLPVSADELKKWDPPFAIVRRDPRGYFRGVVVGGSGTEISALVLAMSKQSVPLGVPFSLSTELTNPTPATRLWIREKANTQSTHFNTRHNPEDQKDADDMLAWADLALEKLLPYYPNLLQTIGQRMTINLHPLGGPVQIGWAFASPSTAEMDFLLPSVSYRENSFYDADWHIGNIAHEIAHILEYAYREQAGGYTTRNIPIWFHEGFGEYFRFLATGHPLPPTLNSQRYQSERSNLIRNGINSFSEPYVAGYWALKFIMKEYGHDAIKGIVESGEPTFWEALREHTGLNTVEFDLRLRRWLEKQ